jgi:four helix bundle protein
MLRNHNELRARTKRFAFDVIDLVKEMPRNLASDAIARQLIRSGTSVSSNHRAAGRARSLREFVAKLGVVVEEIDESELWLEALLTCRLAASDPTERLYREACELRAIFVKSAETARRRLHGAAVIALVILVSFLGLSSSAPKLLSS